MQGNKLDAPEQLSGFKKLMQEIEKIVNPRIPSNNPLPRPLPKPATPASKDKKPCVWDDIP